MSFREFGYKGKYGFRRNMYGDDETIEKWVVKFGPQDIYISVFRYESTNVDSSKLEAGLYFDIDNEDNLEAACEDLQALVAILQSQGVGRKSYDIWFSGFKGFHLTIPWKAMGVGPAKDLPQVYKKIALEFNNLLPNKNIDLSVYEFKRLWRVPNTINSKSGLYKIQLQAEIPCLQKIKQLAKKTQPINQLYTISNPILSLWVDRARREIADASRRKTYSLKFAPNGINPEVERTIQEGVAANRNNTTFYLACYLESKGWGIDDTIRVLSAFGERCTPPASASYSDFTQVAIERTVHSAYKNKGRAE